MFKLLITRPEKDSLEMHQALQEFKIESCCLPLIKTKKLDIYDMNIIDKLHQYTTVVFVSKTAVYHFLDLMNTHSSDYYNKIKWFAIGQKSAKALAPLKLKVSYPLEKFTSEALLDLKDFKSHLTEKKRNVLIVRGVGGRIFLKQNLERLGHDVKYLELYKRSLIYYTSDYIVGLILNNKINAIVVTSLEILKHLYFLSGKKWAIVKKLIFLVPSERIKKESHSLGVNHVIDCNGASTENIIHALNTQFIPFK